MNRNPQIIPRLIGIRRVNWKTPPRTSLRIPAMHGSGGGFTLIELMVAMTIGLLLVTGLVTLYLNISNTNNEMAKTNSLIENGRMAILLLQNDVVHAGFWGTYVPEFDDLTETANPGDEPSAVPDPCLTYNAANWTATYKNNLIGIPVQAYEAIPATCAATLTNKKASTDVLVVRHAETCLPGVGNCEADISGKFYFQSSLCEAEINPSPPVPGQYRYVLDVTPTPPDPTPFTLRTYGCIGTPPATTPPPIPPAPAGAGAIADKRKFISNIYYIRDYADTAGDGIPTLMRSQFDLPGGGGTLAHQPAVALIEGIEGFNVEFGIDNISDSGDDVDYSTSVIWEDPANMISPTNRGDGIPDTYVRCTTAVPCDEFQLSNVVAVKLYVLVRNIETTPGYTDTKSYALGSTALGPFNDNYKRHVFSTTVRLINISGRRETP